MSLILPKRTLSRRHLLQLSGLSGLGLLLNGCGTSLFSNEVGQATEPLNQAIESLLLTQKPTPEYPLSAIEPDKLLINTFDKAPQIDPAKFQLAIAGEVANPLQLSLADLQKLAFTSMVIQHVCVEGWAAIVQWGGVRLQDLAALVQPKSSARYVYFKSADGYYESWDLASALHPQTLMVYQKNGQPLSVDNGAPLRLASPVKLGYKQSKWVTEITFISQLPSKKGYWEDFGYEWFGGV
ncbi:MAG: molybdopterin-dependent oxidoreductase [Timaviella obliquedivisa GSE-PSE-MK23-08B]|jgi:DMSO/TMAO reductase YedYZ molybdopterin-dependent catalytic subunit|nr:molybdopterin-dependent oxidoreductase [Timaviella obliquedivisa GSE-PSE-MK23-08B]